ncbi:hypothetical protein GCM10010251_51370 [Streptomyces aurantiogriseus]|uniref:Uncharacterized protein n=1 Tax=Streptomyces aurantiogriseus TaxID=66870 RepID=A0A918CKA1_9ACTN|nr:hypothetical protein GCM10010251_51370 [Streptomyces aurantiogriseus]
MWWSWLQSGDTAMLRRPLSGVPFTVCGTVPTFVLTPDGVSLKSWKESRSLISAEPSGSQLRPQGMFHPDETVVTAAGIRGAGTDGSGAAWPVAAWGTRSPAAMVTAATARVTWVREDGKALTP